MCTFCVEVGIREQIPEETKCTLASAWLGRRHNNLEPFQPKVHCPRQLLQSHCHAGLFLPAAPNTEPINSRKYGQTSSYIYFISISETGVERRLIYFMWMSVLSEYICVLMNALKGIRSLGTRVNDWEPPCGCWELIHCKSHKCS